jgi:hypothetical protein
MKNQAVERMPSVSPVNIYVGASFSDKPMRLNLMTLSVSVTAPRWLRASRSQCAACSQERRIGEDWASANILSFSA